jgi:ABC-2 type transport system permease protein
MSIAATGATAARVLAQLRHDPRTVGMIVAVPTVLLVVLRYVFDGQVSTFERIAPPMLGLIPFVTMFIVTSVAMLRERTSGTLERLMSTPIRKLELLAGYATAFGVMTVVQVVVVSSITLGPLGADSARPFGVLGIGVVSGLLGMTLGLLVSAFARSEFQAVQFMPMFVLPQFLICGLFVPRDRMADALEWLSYAAPLTYVYDAVERVASPEALGGAFWLDTAVLLAALALALVLGAATLQRRTD